MSQDIPRSSASGTAASAEDSAGRMTESGGSTERFGDRCSGGLSPFTATEMGSPSGEDTSFENTSYAEPHSRRVGITGPPSSFRLSTSTSATETSESASYSTPPSSPSLCASSPPRPPRSPLRPTAPTRRASASLLKQEHSDLAPDTEEMPLSHSRSFGSFSGLLSSQPASIKSTRSLRAPTPDKPLPITPDPSISATSVHDDDRDREQEPGHEQDEHEDAKSACVSVSALVPASSVPVSLSLSGSVSDSSLLRTGISKRIHALEELLSSERAYASDLALIRDIHIPLALGQPAPFQTASSTPSASGSSSRGQSSDLSTGTAASTSTPPPMTREDIRIIFSNVADIAAFSDTFTEQIEEALGSALEGGSGEDHVGALFLATIPTLEPLYLSYITKHASALEHLSSLPQTPALAAYLAQSRSLASSLTHAWDLPSLLIKPVQRLLKYALLLGAIIEETPDTHPDKANLKLARGKMEEVARGVNEGRRRREVIKEVLNGPMASPPSKRNSDPKPKPKKKGLNVGVSKSVSLGRMKSMSGKLGKLKEGSEANQEAEQVVKMGEEVKRCETFARTFAKDAIEWSDLVRASMEHFRVWSLSFGQVIGVTKPEESEAFEAFMIVVSKEIPELCKELETNIKSKVLDDLTKLVDSTLAPLRLLEAMQTLEPLHFGLLNLNVAKTRPSPQLLEASQSYVALRAQLAAELPQYIALLDKGIGLCIRKFIALQAEFWGRVRDRWLVLWNALKVEGEMNAGAAETVRVWWSRFADVESSVLGLNIVRQPERRHPAGRQMSNFRMKLVDDSWSETSSTVIVSSILTSMDPLNEPPSSPSTLSLQTPVSAKARSVRSMEIGKARPPERRNSNESLRSKKSGKSTKSTKSTGHGPTHSINNVDSEEIGYGYRAALVHLEAVPQKPVYSRTKSMPIASPLPLKKSHSQGRMLDQSEIIRMRVPPHAALEIAQERQYSLDHDRGRPTRKPSFKRRLTETLLPGTATSTRHQRSPSLPIGLSPSPSPSPKISSFPGGSASSSRHMRRRPSVSGSKFPAMYSCRVVHVCEPPAGVSYRDLPFFTLRVGDTYDVLQEAGHPSLHKDLPLYVDDGEDCLLLVRNELHDIGWALASFLVPTD